MARDVHHTEGRFSCSTCDVPLPRATWYFTLDNLCYYFSPLQERLDHISALFFCRERQSSLKWFGTTFVGGGGIFTGIVGLLNLVLHSFWRGALQLDMTCFSDTNQLVKDFNCDEMEEDLLKIEGFPIFEGVLVLTVSTGCTIGLLNLAVSQWAVEALASCSDSLRDVQIIT